MEDVEEEVVAVAATFESAALMSVVKVLLGCGTTVTLRVVVAAVRDDVVVGCVLVGMGIFNLLPRSFFFDCRVINSLHSMRRACMRA